MTRTSGDTMTKDEAKETLKNCEEYWYIHPYGSTDRVSLDGFFTAKELEAIIVLLKDDAP